MDNIKMQLKYNQQDLLTALQKYLWSKKRQNFKMWHSPFAIRQLCLHFGIQIMNSINDVVTI